MTQTRFWLIRHAVVPNLEKRIYGATDPACDTSNRALMEGTARQLPRDAVWVTSHLQRTRQTADALLEAGELTPALRLEEADLGEQNFGALQGKTWEELEREPDFNTSDYWRIPGEVVPPGGESFAQVKARASAVYHRLIEDHSGKDIVCIVHGGTIRAALGLAMDLSPSKSLNFTIDNVSLTKISHFRINGSPEGVWRVDGLNILPLPA